MTLLSNDKSEVEVFFRFCGLLRKSELYALFFQPNENKAYIYIRPKYFHMWLQKDNYLYHIGTRIWVNTWNAIRPLSYGGGGCEVFSFWLSKQNKKHLSIDVSNWTDFFLNKLFQLSSYLKITIKACLAEVFYSFKMDRHFLRQKVCQRISVMKTNTVFFVVFMSKRGLKMLILWKHRLCFFSLLRTFWQSFFDVIKNFR